MKQPQAPKPGTARSPYRKVGHRSVRGCGGWLLRIIFKCRIVERKRKNKVVCALLVYGPYCLAFCIMNGHKHGTVAPPPPQETGGGEPGQLCVAHKVVHSFL